MCLIVFICYDFIRTSLMLCLHVGGAGKTSNCCRQQRKNHLSKPGGVAMDFISNNIDVIAVMVSILGIIANIVIHKCEK